MAAACRSGKNRALGQSHSTAAVQDQEYRRPVIFFISAKSQFWIEIRGVNNRKNNNREKYHRKILTQPLESCCFWKKTLRVWLIKKTSIPPAMMTSAAPRYEKSLEIISNFATLDNLTSKEFQTSLKQNTNHDDTTTTTSSSSSQRGPHLDMLKSLELYNPRNPMDFSAALK